MNAQSLGWLDRAQAVICTVCETDASGRHTTCMSGFVVALAAVLLAALAFRVVRASYKFAELYLVGPHICPGVAAFKAKYEDHWAIVSGGSDGIGLGFAKQFAKHGFRVVILSRSKAKLERARSLLLALGAPQVETISVDFAVQDDGEYERVRRELDLATKRVACLVNNVGVLGKVQRLHAFSFDALKAQVNVNNVAALFLTTHVLPQMRARGHGVVVNVSSAAALHAYPFFGVYSATKIWVDYFSRLLHTEYGELSVVNLNTNGVSTQLSLDTGLQSVRENRFSLSADAYTESAFAIVAKAAARGQLVETSGCKLHELLNYVQRALGKLGLLGLAFSAAMGVSAAKLDAAAAAQAEGRAPSRLGHED